MKKVIMSYQEMVSRFMENESKNLPPITGYIVFTEDSFSKYYTEESRTYVVSSRNKAYMPRMGGYSIFASCLDGTDQGLRLEGYMAVERGGNDGWKVDHCYMYV